MTKLVSPEPNPTPAPRLLLVDDEPALLLSYKAILEHQGYSVTTAATSSEAFDRLSGASFDLLLCDLALEKPNGGLEVVCWAREQKPGMACALLTGYLDSAASEQAQQLGVQTLYKPVEIPKLLETIDFMLRRQRMGQ